MRCQNQAKMSSALQDCGGVSRYANFMVMITISFSDCNKHNMDATASSIIGVVQPYMFEPPEPQSDSESEGIDQPPTHRGSTTGGGCAQ